MSILLIEVFIEKHPTKEEEDREEVSSDVIKSNKGKWSECQHFFEKHATNASRMNRMLNLMNNIIDCHFWRVIQSIRQIFLSKLTIQTRDKEEKSLMISLTSLGIGTHPPHRKSPQARLVSSLFVLYSTILFHILWLKAHMVQNGLN